MEHLHQETADRLIEMAVANVQEGGGPFSCIILDASGKILGSGCNRVVEECDPTAHAEILALRDACRGIRSFRLPKGSMVFSSCEPCPMCRAALLWAGVSTLLYIATRDDADQAGFDDKIFHEAWDQWPHAMGVEVVHVHHPQADKPFRQWQDHPGKTPY